VSIFLIGLLFLGLLVALNDVGFVKAVPEEQVETPIISPGNGNYAPPLAVVIYCSTPGVTIAYALDGSALTYESTEYTGPISVSMSGTVRAWAFRPSHYTHDDGTPVGYVASGIASATYTFAPYTITASVDGEGGIIDPAGSTIVPQGGSQSFTITHNEGYLIQDVKVDGNSIHPGFYTFTYPFHNVDRDHTITASFETIPSFPMQGEFNLKFEHHEVDDPNYFHGYGTTPMFNFFGTISRAQIVSDIIITPMPLSMSTTIAFSVNGNDGDVGSTTMTIPESAVPYGTTPVVYIDGALLEAQSFTQGAGNFQVWFSIPHFSTHEITIQFVNSLFPLPENIFGTLGAIGAALAAFGIITIRKDRKHKI
jgi:hypothetical protein